MRHIGLLLCAAASLAAAERPRFGGTLRVEMRAYTLTLDPAAADPSAAHDRVCRLLYDRLVEVDERGALQPSLATEWKRDGERWLYKVRPGAVFHDGSPVARGSEWIAGDDPETMSRLDRSVVKRAGAETIGSGPFRVVEWQRGRLLTVAASPSHWAGRPFLDGVELRMGRPLREQLAALELNRADVIEIAAGPGRRPAHVASSDPVELLALRFDKSVDASTRAAIGRSIDRASIHSVLLQRQGAATGAILPPGLTGWAGLFPSARDLSVSRGPARTITLGTDPLDPVLRLIADRIMVNARDVAVTMRPPAPGAAAQASLVRVRIAAATIGEAMTVAARALDLPGAAMDSADRQLALEAEWLRSGIIPIAHLPETVGLGARVRNWKTMPFGAWRIDEVWLK